MLALCNRPGSVTIQSMKPDLSLLSRDELLELREEVRTAIRAAIRVRNERMKTAHTRFVPPPPQQAKNEDGTQPDVTQHIPTPAPEPNDLLRERDAWLARRG